MLSLSILLLMTITSSAFLTPKVPSTRVPSQVKSSSSSSSDCYFTVGVLGDLHQDPRDLEEYKVGRAHFRKIFANSSPDNTCLVSLGDLGESKVIDNDAGELYSGTTRCHQRAARYLRSFRVPYEVVGGNHDLEGIDEFTTDQENLDMFLRIHKKPTPQFIRQIADKTILVGLTSTKFRDATYTSHEVIIDQEQLDWFEETLKKHPSSEGWKVFVFTHAPPLGSGLKVLPDNHVVNGCCWLNHSNEEQSKRFIELVREHRCIKAWFSGHFHLGQNYRDSITFPNEDNTDRGSCVFVQTSVMRSGTSRDGSQQSRLIRGDAEGFQICTIDHQQGGRIRLDATVTYSDCDNEVGVYEDDELTLGKEQEEEIMDTFKQVYCPLDDSEEAPYPSDDDFLDYEDSIISVKDVAKDTTAWWNLADGRVLGLFNGMLLEYEPSTLAPMGLVVGSDEMIGKSVAVIDVSVDSDDDTPIQAVLLVDEDSGKVVVVQPNEDGSYWRKIVRNKIVRMREMRREKAAKAFAAKLFTNVKVEDVVSTWGPYTSTSGTAKATGVPGVTI